MVRGGERTHVLTVRPQESATISSTEVWSAGDCSECSPNIKTLRDGPEDVFCWTCKMFGDKSPTPCKISEAGAKKQ